jgi:hypothetical protein
MTMIGIIPVIYIMFAVVNSLGDERGSKRMLAVECFNNQM